MNFLLQPKKFTGLMVDEGSRTIMTKTIRFLRDHGQDQAPRGFQ